MLEAGGGYLGSTLGAFAYDVFGFQWATVVESGVSLLFVRVQYPEGHHQDHQDHPYNQGDGHHGSGPGDLHAGKATTRMREIRLIIFFHDLK